MNPYIRQTIFAETNTATITRPQHWKRCCGRAFLFIGNTHLTCYQFTKMIAFDSIQTTSKGTDMPSITVRNLSEETHRALKARALAAGRSTEAEIRLILDQAARPKQRIRLGSLLSDIGREAGGVDLDIERQEQTEVRF
nr:MAG TPA: Plasmid stability protein [Inoviridae sp.]